MLTRIEKPAETTLFVSESEEQENPTREEIELISALIREEKNGQKIFQDFQNSCLQGKIYRGAEDFSLAEAVVRQAVDDVVKYADNPPDDAEAWTRAHLALQGLNWLLGGVSITENALTIEECLRHDVYFREQTIPALTRRLSPAHNRLLQETLHAQLVGEALDIY